MTESAKIKVPPNVLSAVEKDLKENQWQFEPLVVKSLSPVELATLYKTAMSVVFAVKKEILKNGGKGAT